MTNLVFVGISPVIKAGEKMTPKANVAFLQKEVYPKGDEQVTRYNLIVATAWKGMIDNFNGATPGMIVPTVELKSTSRIYQGKVYTDITIMSVDKKFITKELMGDTAAELERLRKLFSTTYDDNQIPASKPSKPASKASTTPAAADDDLPF